MNLGKQLGWIEGNLDVGRVKVVLPLLSFHWEKLKVVLKTLHRDAFRTRGHTRERCIFHSDCERSVSVRCQWWRHLFIAKTAEGNTEHLWHTHTHTHTITLIQHQHKFDFMGVTDLCLYLRERLFQKSISSSFEENLGIMSVSMANQSEREAERRTEDE